MLRGVGACDVVCGVGDWGVAGVLGGWCVVWLGLEGLWGGVLCCGGCGLVRKVGVVLGWGVGVGDWGRSSRPSFCEVGKTHENVL